MPIESCLLAKNNTTSRAIVKYAVGTWLVICVIVIRDSDRKRHKRSIWENVAVYMAEQLSSFLRKLAHYHHRNERDSYDVDGSNRLCAGKLRWVIRRTARSRANHHRCGIGR